MGKAYIINLRVPVDANPELQLIDMLMQASEVFNQELSAESKKRAINYFAEWSKSQLVEGE
jgi:hypothetical protein